MRTTTSDEWRRQLLLGGGLVCHALLLASCSSSEGAAPPPAPVLTTLTVALAEPSIQVGRTTIASVAGRDQFGATMAVSAPTWSAAPSTVATIGSSGVATGVSPGQATITGTVGSLSAAATLSVTPPSPVPACMARQHQPVGPVYPGHARVPAVSAPRRHERRMRWLRQTCA